MLSEELIKKLNDNTDFTAFKEWLVDQVFEIDSVADLDSMSNELAGEEAKVRYKTKTRLLSILAPFMNIREAQEPSHDAVNRAKKKHGF